LETGAGVGILGFIAMKKEMEEAKKWDELTEEKKERLRSKYLKHIKDMQKRKPELEKLEKLAQRVATEIYKNDLGDFRQFDKKEDALVLARRMVGLPKTEKEIKDEHEEESTRFVNIFLTELLSSEIRQGGRVELNTARICRMVGADARKIDLGDVDREKVKRNFRKTDGERCGLVSPGQLRVLRNWKYSVDLKAKDGSWLTRPLVRMNLVDSVRALGWADYNSTCPRLKKAMERYRKITDRLGLRRKDKKSRSLT
jgi:hypothetical protein